jgi:Ca2+-binding EF-hand superfamily protein/lambda repressor-like predicted transcriptional regulator
MIARVFLFLRSIKKSTKNSATEKFEGESSEEVARKAMDDEQQLIFAEFTFMLRGNLLSQYLGNADWQGRADAMMKLREAFDCADVDGNNQLELDELEFVVLSMNPKAETTADDIHEVWAVLNPDKKPFITFTEFTYGMIKVREDPELSTVVPMDVPNRFELLSLVIDSPINEAEEKLIFMNMGPLERFGVGILRRTEKGSDTMDMATIKAKVSEGCCGTLHVLTKEQRSKADWLHYSCVAQACFIGGFFTLLPGLFENWLVYTYETDGMVDAYWTCPGETRDAGARGEEFGATDSLWPMIGGSMVPPFHNLSLPTCPYGTCTSVPANVSAYMETGGNAAMGGLWTNTQPLSDECTLKAPKATDCGDSYKQVSCSESSWRWCDPELFGTEVELNCSPLQMTPFDSSRLHIWWVLNVIGIVTGIVFELGLLMYTAVRSAVLVSAAVDLRLIPLNQDRAFVADMLVRAAFEMGDPEGEFLGVQTEIDDDARERSGAEDTLRNILSAVWYKGKAIITGVLLKQVTVRWLTTYDTATWIKPFAGTMAATIFWDGMTCHSIMKAAELRAIGVTTGVEVFNEIMSVRVHN